MPDASDMPNGSGEPAVQSDPASDGAVAVFIETLVRDARLPDARARDDLRRELAAHFEDAAADSRAAGSVVARFGAPREVAAGLRRAHRPWGAALRAAKVLGAVAVSLAVALPLQAAAHLRVASAGVRGVGGHASGLVVPGGFGLGVTPWFGFAARMAVGVVLLAVAAWELDVEPAAHRLDREPARLAAAVLALFAASTAAHAWRGLPVDPVEQFAGATAMVGAWTAALAVAARADRALVRVFGGSL